MIKKLIQTKVIERYDHYLSVATGKKFELRWKSKIIQYYTCGLSESVVECIDLIPESVEIYPLSESGIKEKRLTIKSFNTLNPNEQLDFRCNCHGFTFANGKYCITNEYIPAILKDEFNEVTEFGRIQEGNFDVICCKDTTSGEWIHSSKYQFDLYIHKVGIRKFSIHASIEELLEIPEYKDSEVHYFKRSMKNCPGICLNAIGEPHVKTFANN